MSLSIKQLQARARAFYASSTPSPFAVSPVVPSLHPIYSPLPMRKPVLPTPSAPVLTMSPFARDMFSVVYAGIPSAMALYDRIECAPSVGRNLRAQA